jgi:predicted AAA+ superfamily ATPase
MAQESGKAVLFLDEIGHMTDWGVKLKGAFDRVLRLKLPIHVVASGSSSLQIGTGAKESLAGRFEKLVLPHWSPKTIAGVFEVSPELAVDYFVTRGGYPGSFNLRQEPTRWSAYVRDSILEPAIGRDILALNMVRRPALLRQIFLIAAAAPCQIMALQKIQGQLQDKGALATISHYLELLEHAFLVAPIHKYTHQAFRRRESPPKLVVLNPAISAVMDPRGIPNRELEPARFGFWVENACLALLKNNGFNLMYWREEPFEVDAIIDEGSEKWAIEVKTGPFTGTDLKGLFEFTRQYPEFKPLVLCDEKEKNAAKRLGVESLSWQEFLLR